MPAPYWGLSICWLSTLPCASSQRAGPEVGIMEEAIKPVGGGAAVGTAVVVRTGDMVVTGDAAATDGTEAAEGIEAVTCAVSVGTAVERVVGSQPDSARRRRKAEAYLKKRFSNILPIIQQYRYAQDHRRPQPRQQALLKA